MRFNNFLFSKVSNLCTRSNHKSAEKLLEEVTTYDKVSISDRPKLLNKVSVFMGYNSLQDLLENERSDLESVMNFEESNAYNVILACKRFPSIILGSSPRIELFGESQHFSEAGLLAEKIRKEFLATSVGAKWAHRISETLDSLPAPQNVKPPTLDEINTCNSNLVTEQLDMLQVASEQHVKSSSVNFPSDSHIEKMSDSVSIKDENVTKDAIVTQENGLPVHLIMDKTISVVAGLTKRQCTQLENGGFHTLRKLLHHFPRTYVDLQNAQIGIDDGQYLIFVGNVLSSRGIKASFSFSFLEVVVECEVADIDSNSELGSDESNYKSKKTIYLHLKKYFRGTRFTCQPFLKSLQEKHKIGDVVCVSGKVKTMRTKNHYEMREYNIDVIQDRDSSNDCAKERPYPIYPSKGGLSPSFLRGIISRTLQDLPANVDPIPKEITKDFDLIRLHDAYRGIHQPISLNEADLARKRLIFDEFFYIQLGRLFQLLGGLGTEIEKEGLLDKYRNPELNSVYIEEWCNLTKELLRSLPYTLTPSQLNAVSEIIWDLRRKVPMNRLLQGDVGCGKTMVAFLACMEVVGSGYQAAFMVPTELLAIQHYEHLLNLIENLEDVKCKPSVALLTGSTPTKQSRIIREGLQNGDISIVIGTHSLIADKVEFSALRIAVVDEQHRFGVIQRGRFNSKLSYTSLCAKLGDTKSDGSPKGDMAPHILAMSATPIPRTLALALYGDMSLTQITDLPPGRLPVETHIVEANETGYEKVYKMMLEEVEDGGKVYVVYPIIEQSEQLPQLRAASADYEAISARFKLYKCGLLHGKMKSDEKEEALRGFRSGDTNILLSTQVIEIGVDVPDASMMIVMNAERFGIAQLHQLRGRVGRGVRKSKCLLLAPTALSLNRLKILEKSSDGFYLANMDLALRGPGDLLGRKQSGHLPEFPITRLEIDGSILQDAHRAALKILSDSHDLEKFPDLKAELSMRQPLCILGD
jgi:ATP-dependent DNA helicase RecG